MPTAAVARSLPQASAATAYGGVSGDGGLPLYSSPATGSRLSYTDRSHLSNARRDEYAELARRSVLPKVVSLASRLVPAVATEMERGSHSRKMQHEPSGQGSKEQEGSPGTERLKTTGLYEGNEADRAAVPEPCSPSEAKSAEAEGLYLPRSAAVAALSEGLKKHQEDTEHSPPPQASGVVPVDAIAAGLGPDVALLDMEADALLESIRNEALSPSSSGTARHALHEMSFRRDSDDNAAEEEESVDWCGEEDDAVQSYDSDDEDDMGGEIRRLGNVIASLRNDLRGASIDSMQRDLCAADEEDGTGAPVCPPPGNDSNGGSRLSIVWGTADDAANELASHLKTWGVYGTRTGGSHVPLYWAVALIWAIVILLAGHVSFSSMDSDGGLSSWPAVLEWLEKLIYPDWMRQGF